MDLVQLRTFIQVAELGSLSKAADRIRIAQPALSRQIRLLEEELGTELFTRHGRGMVITERGQQVLQHASLVMAAVNDLKAQAADRVEQLTGRVAIGMPPTVSDLISVPLVAALNGAHPKLELRLVGSFTGHLIDWLQRGEIDVAVLYDPQATRSLRSQPLLIENLMLIGPANGVLSPIRAIPFKRLAEEHVLLPSPRHGLRNIIDRCASEAGVSLKVHIEADSFSTLKDLVQHGYGYTILPLSAVDREIKSGQLCAAPLIEPTPMRRLVLASARDRPPNRAGQSTAALIMSTVEKLVKNGSWSAQLI